MRGVIASLLLILLMLLSWSIISDKRNVEKEKEVTEFITFSEDELRELILEDIEINPEVWIYDEEYGTRAREVLEEKNIYIVTGTVYNAVVAQCNSNPLVTADGSRIDKSKLNSGEIKWIAVSRDLLKRGLSYGDKVIVRNIKNQDYEGIYEIHDTMNSRYESYIDFLVPDHITLGKWHDVIIEKVKE